MYRILDYAPPAIKQYIRLLQSRRRFPNCRIDSHLISVKAILGFECMVARDVELGPNVTIGDYSYVNAGTIIASGQVGKFCSIGYYCQIGMPDHPVDYLSTSPRTYGGRNIFNIPSFWDDYPSPPIIESDVWIGSQALILQRVHIGHGAIVAGGAVVTEDVPPYTIVGGVPARPIRKRFDEDVIDCLLELQWWNYSLEQLHQMQGIFELKQSAASSLAKHKNDRASVRRNL